jgi:hypothetical protein
MTKATFFERPMCRIMGKAIFGNLCSFLRVYGNLRGCPNQVWNYGRK